MFKLVELDKKLKKSLKNKVSFNNFKEKAINKPEDLFKKLLKNF